MVDAVNEIENDMGLHQTGVRRKGDQQNYEKISNVKCTPKTRTSSQRTKRSSKRLSVNSNVNDVSWHTPKEASTPCEPTTLQSKIKPLSKKKQAQLYKSLFTLPSPMHPSQESDISISLEPAVKNKRLFKNHIENSANNLTNTKENSKFTEIIKKQNSPHLSKEIIIANKPNIVKSLDLDGDDNTRYGDASKNKDCLQKQEEHHSSISNQTEMGESSQPTHKTTGIKLKYCKNI